MKLAIALTVAILVVPSFALAKDFNDLSVNEVTCIDVIGPWNKVGTIIQKNSSNQKVLVRGENGKEKWYKASKTRGVFSCKVSKEIAGWLLEKGIETAVSQSQ